MLDRYLLRYFLAVVDQGNFSKAAQACNVAQPTLSVGISKLEKIVGHPLFLRSNQRVELTDAGTRFIGHARHIEREFHVAMQSMGHSVDLLPLRMGVLTSIPTDIVAAAVAKVEPGKENRFELVFGNEREIISHLAKGRIDLGLTLVDRGAIRFAERALMVEGYSLALSTDHNLAARPEIAPEELAQEPMIVRRHCEALAETSRFFTERGVRPHFAMRSTSDERVLQMVGAGLGLTVMPDCYIYSGVARPRLVGFHYQRTIGWIAGHDHEHLLETPKLIMQAIEATLSVTSLRDGATP